MGNRRLIVNHQGVSATIAPATSTTVAADISDVAPFDLSPTRQGYIVTRISGGLGNQLFQYAAGRAGALRNGCNLVLDARPLETNSLRNYELHHFNIAAKIGTHAELPPDRVSKVRYLLWKTGRDARRRLIREKSLRFDQKVLGASADAILHGYWQCERYFADFAQKIRDDLTVKTPASGANREWLDRLCSTNTVSVHIRRGDYVSDKKIQSRYASCSPEYYRNAAERILDTVGSELEFLVFSDDPDWVEQEIKLPGALHVIRHNSGDHAFEDLRLMSACGHHIIANSSFSWWGAWLNPSSDKIVVAPKQWFRNENEREHDIVPDSWVRC
ncbi:MAG: alpha-1,2-fucosyltransferase [Planctomycetes bacterium]|nr:alpha-1,2-fucosyltransferase [Planctomycetota bacterium]